MNTISVLSDSHTFDVAEAIASTIREQKQAEIEATGAEAVNRAVKALSLATEYLRAEDIFITCVSQGANALIENGKETAIRIVVDPYYPH